MKTIIQEKRISPAVSERNESESRAILISRSLRQVAKRSRKPKNLFVAGGGPERRWASAFPWIIILSFVFIVLVPNAVGGIYLSVFASDQYATETRVALRGGDSSVADQFGGLIGLPVGQRIQDSMILVDYIRGRGMVDALDAQLNFRGLFSRDHIDPLSRFDRERTNDELVYYWRKHVDVHLDNVSGIITIVVRAFSASDSLLLMNAILEQSERMVNDLSDRSRRDSLRLAEAQMMRAKDALEEKARVMQDARNEEGVLDSAAASSSLTKMIAELRLQLIQMKQAYSAQNTTISADAPQLRVLKAQIDSLNSQIERVERQMASARSSSTLAASMRRLDLASLEEDIAQKQYAASSLAYEQARLELKTQGVYLVSFLKPVLAQEALYPKRWWLWSIVTFVGLVCWAAICGTAVLLRNYIAV